MDALTAQLATFPAATLEAMARAVLCPAPRLMEALRLAHAREVAQRNAAAFPALQWVTL